MPRQKTEQNPRKMPPTRGNPKRREENREERSSERTQQCRNINSPRQFNTQRCNATKKKSHGDGKIILFRPVDLGRLRARPQPSARDSFPLVTCGFLQRRTKGSPSGRLHSDAQVSQQETPKTMHLRIGAPRMAL